MSGLMTVDYLQRVVSFWLDQGVDGFYIRDLPFLFEDRDLRDETPLSQNSYSGASSDDYASYRHENTRDLSESYQIIQDLFVSTINPYNKQQKM
jgi:alpha-glucosidase